MSSSKAESDIQQFERRISNAILSLLIFTVSITTILFGIIYYQNLLQQKVIKSKDIDSAISLFQHNLSEKISIISSSNVFMDFLASGDASRENIKSQFLTELLPLRSSGIIGYSLINSETGTNYHYGNTSVQSLTLKLCYLSNKLDSENGNCYGSLKLFFSENLIFRELSRINNSIKRCDYCNRYNFIKNGYFGNFPVDGQSEFNINITTDIKRENIIYYYIVIIFTLVGLSLFNKSRLRRMIKETISNPLDLLVKKIKTQQALQENPKALQEINYLSTQIEIRREQISKINEYEKEAALGHLAAEVAHDIRSPLAVLEITASNISNNIQGSQHFILKQAIQSVRDIANNLLEHHRSPKLSFTSENHTKSNSYLYDDGNIERPILLSSLLEMTSSQKRQEWLINPCELDVVISSEAKRKWITGSPNDIKRIISNLLNNAYESLSSHRKINITLTTSNDMLKIEIRDSGNGIPDNIIKHVLNGLSLKHAGKGLGLSSASQYMQNINGSLELFSTLNKGTSISLYFPCKQKPKWISDTITINENNIIIILDDDVSMHNFWKFRFQSKYLKTIHFSNSISMLEWHKSNVVLSHQAIYLIDYELRDERLNGLDVLTELAAQHRSYLITSHAEESLIHEQCAKLKVWLISKALVGDLEIIFNA
jgi:signal transduction histidine kinase